VVGASNLTTSLCVMGRNVSHVLSQEFPEPRYLKPSEVGVSKLNRNGQAPTVPQ